MAIRRGYIDLAQAGLGIVVLLSLALGRGWAPSESKGTKGSIPLRLAYFPNLTHAPALIGVASKRYAQELPGYSLSTRVVNAGPEAMEALLAGEVDIAFVGPSPAINTYVKTGGKALTIISAACSGGASLIAREGERIDSVADLDGRSVAVPQLGGTQDVSLRHFLAREGLKPQDQGGTVRIVPVANPDILTLFKRHQIDAAWVPEPWASRLRLEGGGHTAIDERTLWPNGKFTTTVVVVRNGFAQAHPSAVRDFLRAHAATIAWIGSHETEAQVLVNTELKRLTGKALKPEIIREAWKNVTFTTDPDPTNILAFAAAARDAGYLKDGGPSLAGLVASTTTAPPLAYFNRRQSH